jgi:predicted nucleotidyltransferase component of viral defense system
MTEQPLDTFYHSSVMFSDALMLTQQRTGFATHLIEKDYFCTLVLEHLASACPELVFKGGTCLAKVFTDFYRLSEDLDFVIPVSEDTPRSQRSRMTAGVKQAMARLPTRLPFFHVIDPFTGANRSTQYKAVIGYESPASRHEETIKVEVALREPLLLPTQNGLAKTIVLDPITCSPALGPVGVRTISKIEAFAEKFRAALSRREVAARDFFDLDFAVRQLGLNINDGELIELVRRKMAVVGNPPTNVSSARLAELRRQTEPQLRPVLRTKDFAQFDIDRAFGLVAGMAAKIR